MIISPSILAADFLNLETEISHFKEQTDLWLHLDVMDGHFVPNMTFGIPIIKQLAKKTRLPLDVHLMVTNPEFYLENLCDTSLNNMTFHYEAHSDQLSFVKNIKKYFKAGISLKPKTSIDVLDHELLSELDLILIMSVEPGFGGQKFMNDSLDKVSKLKKLREENNYSYTIQIDGGINDQTSKLAIEAGVDNMVAGSYIFKNNPQDYLKFVNNLRK